MVGAVSAVRHVARKMSSASSAGGDEVGVVDERRAVAELGEQVAAEQRRGRLVEQDLRLPAVGDVRRR